MRKIEMKRITKHSMEKIDFFAPLASGLGATRRAAMLLLVMMLTTATAWAQTTITPPPPSQDDDGYYLIGTAAELYGFAELVNNGNASANAKLTADIVVNENVLDANGEANTGDFVQWTPIGNDYFEGKVYSGTFDGQGHTVSGLYVSGNGWNVGFVGRVSGTAVVKNLGIVDSYFNSSNNFLGSIVGGVAEKSSVTIANVYSTSTVKGENYIGGLAGGGDGSVSVVNSYFAGKTSTNWAYGSHHDDLVAGDFNRSTLTVCNAFVLGTSQYGTSVTAEQLSDGTVAAALHYYQDALADGSMFGLSGGKTNFSGTIDGVSVTTANITLHTFDGDATAYSSKYIVGNTTPLPVNVEREGYTFFGWYDNADLEGDVVTQIPSSATDDKEYWAKFERSHSVTFVLNGGSIFKGEIDHYIEGETTVLPTVVFKNGASFEGWYTMEDFTGDRYYSIPATATEDMTFYAKWGAKKTTFDLRQGGSPEPVSILYEGENIVWLDETTTERYVISDNFYNYWSPIPDINVPYTGGASTFDHNISEISVAQSGFYVFTLTDMGDESWFVSILKSMLNCDVASIPTQVYTGSAIEPDVTVKDGETTLTLGTDYEVAYSNNVNAGTATVTITGKGNYSGETAATFTIVKSMTNDGITIAAIADRTYTGSAIEPEVTVTDGETTLTLGTDYTIGYSANVNVGTATATITGMGNYSGEKAATFTISPKAVTNDGITVTIPSQTWTGSAIEPDVTVKDGETTLIENTDYTVTAPSGTVQDAGNYTYTITGIGNYTGTKEATLTIKAKETNCGAITLVEDQNGVTAIFDGTSDESITITDDIEVNSVTYNRTFTEGKPSTVMLPFNKAVSEIGGGKFYTFGGVEKKNNKWEATMNEVTGSLTANTPYLFVPTGTSLTFTGGATLNTTGGGNCLASDTEGWEFHGTYEKKVWDEAVTHDYGFAAVSGKSVDGQKDVEAGQFVRLTTGASAKPMRCYLSYVGGPNQARALTRGAAATDEELPSSIIVRLVGANGQTTSIGTIDNGQLTIDNYADADGWYDLQGRKLSGKPTKSGLYIKNGKKFVIK